jgi:hypothetical protein
LSVTFVLVAIATLGMAYFDRAARALFAAPQSRSRRGASRMAMDDGALTAWEDEGGARARR